MNVRFKIRMVVLLMGLFASQVAAEILNSGFEDYYVDSNGFNIPTDYNIVTKYYRWEERYGKNEYAYSVTEFVPDPNQIRDGFTLKWKVDKIRPTEGNRFAILDTDGSGEGPNDVKISQVLQCQAGDRIFGQYFFGTYDWNPYSDYATISLVPYDSNQPTIEILRVGVEDTDSYSSMEDWEWFSYTIKPGEEGQYDLCFRIQDMSDSLYASFLALDNLRHCSGNFEGDLNDDCRVDFLDYARMNQCLSYSTIDHPSCVDCDINMDGQVDMYDLFYILDQWLSGN